MAGNPLSIEGLSGGMAAASVQREQTNIASMGQRIQRVREGAAEALKTVGEGDGSGSFASILKKSLEKVNQHQLDADTAIKEYVAGRNKNPHETMLAIERAELSLKLMMQVRNKVLEAYKEISRMQV